VPWQATVDLSAELTTCFSLDSQQPKGIARRRQHTRDYRLAMRLSTLLWRDDSMTESEIAHLLGMCERTVSNWLRLYARKGWTPYAPCTTRAIPAS
jgi:hypothetical protein